MRPPSTGPSSAAPSSKDALTASVSPSPDSATPFPNASRSPFGPSFLAGGVGPPEDLPEGGFRGSMPRFERGRQARPRLVQYR